MGEIADKIVEAFLENLPNDWQIREDLAEAIGAALEPQLIQLEQAALVELPRLTEVVTELSIDIPHEAPKHTHYHVPAGHVLSSVGGAIRIEPSTQASDADAVVASRHTLYMSLHPEPRGEGWKLGDAAWVAARPKFKKGDTVMLTNDGGAEDLASRIGSDAKVIEDFFVPDTYHDLFKIEFADGARYFASAAMINLKEKDDAPTERLVPRSVPPETDQSLRMRIKDIQGKSEADGIIANLATGEILDALVRRYGLQRDGVTDELTKLRNQLPKGMEHCTILFKECEKGHGRLIAANWIDHGCLQCKINELVFTGRNRT
jgi:hypothetical protein